MDLTDSNDLPSMGIQKFIGMQRLFRGSGKQAWRLVELQARREKGHFRMPCCEEDPFLFSENHMYLDSEWNGKTF